MDEGPRRPGLKNPIMPWNAGANRAIHRLDLQNVQWPHEISRTDVGLCEASDDNCHRDMIVARQLFVNPLDRVITSPIYPGLRGARNRRGSDHRKALAKIGK
jgi:hypothetical protein